MKVTYAPAEEVKKFKPITLNITIENEEELADLYTKCIDWLLTWSELQLEDAIKLTRTKNEIRGL